MKILQGIRARRRHEPWSSWIRFVGSNRRLSLTRCNKDCDIDIGVAEGARVPL